MTVSFSLEIFQGSRGPDITKTSWALVLVMSLFLAHFYSYGVILCVPGSWFSSLPGLLFPGSITAFNICFHSLYKFFLLSTYHLSFFCLPCQSFFLSSVIPLKFGISSLICYFIFILHIDFCHINSTFNFFQCGFYFSYWGFVSFLWPCLLFLFSFSVIPYTLYALSSPF